MNNNSNYYPPPAADSYAARSAQAYSNVNGTTPMDGSGSGGMNMNGQMGGGGPGNGAPNPNPGQGQYPQQSPQPQPSYGQMYPPQQQQQQMNMPSMMPPGPPPPPQQQPPQQFQQPPTNMPPQQFYPQQQQQQPQHPMQVPMPSTIPQPYAQQSQFNVNNNFNPTVKTNPLDQILNDSIRRMQESTHIMHGAMEANDLATTLDRAAAMLGELGDPKHHHSHHHHHHSHGQHHPSMNSSKEPKAVMSPKHYYELHMMALEELPNLEEFFLSFTATGIAPTNPNPPTIMMPQPNPYGNGMPMQMPVQVPPATLRITMKDLYEIVQYCPRAVPRLYLQICAGSALIRSKEMSVKHVLQELKDAVKCVQCPIRGLFLRHYLLQAVKDKLPDECEVSDVVQVQVQVNTNAGEVQVLEGNVNPEEAQKMEASRSEEVLDTDTGLNTTMEQVEDQMDNFQKEMDETMLKHTKALEDLMGDLGVDDHDSTTSAKDEIDLAGAAATSAAANDTMTDLMGGTDTTTGGGLFDDVNVNVAVAPTPVPSTMPPMPPPMPAAIPPAANVATGAEEEKQDNNDPNTTGTVKDSYQFVLSNFIEMNKLWVRIQHMPGDSKTKEIKRKRERERNELRMMVGTNLVRLSELEGVTSALYGTVILPTVLDQIVACHDPLAQAYLMDCIIQVFPDEFHIQTLEVVLSVCPKLREKVNIRTILQSVMNRLANYYADELLLNDEEDTEGVKMSVMLDSYHMFDDCIKSVFNARGSKLTAREAIRLESSLLDFSLKCYPGRMDYIDLCLGNCAAALRGEMTVPGSQINSISNTAVVPPTPIQLDNSAIAELEKILSMPLEEMALNILGLQHYSELLALLPWDNRRKVAVTLLQVLDTSEQKMTNIREMDQLFAIMTPLLQYNGSGSVGGAGVGGPPPKSNEDDALVAKVIHLIYNEDTDVHFEMLSCAKRRISSCGDKGVHIVPLFYEALNLLNRIKELEFPAPLPIEEPEIDGEEDEEQVDEEEQEQEQKTEIVEVDAEEGKEGGSEAEENSPVVSDEKLEDEGIANAESGDVDDNKDNTENNDADDQISETNVDDAEAKAEVDADTNEQAEGIEKKIDEKDVDEEEPSPTVTQQSAGDQTPPSKNELFGISKDDLFGDGPVEGDENAAEQTPEPPSFTKEITCRKVFLFIQKILLSLRSSDDMEQTINCSLNAATAASSCFFAAVTGGFDGSCFTPVAYEFFTETFHIYESCVLDAKVQQRLLVALIGSLLVSARSFGESDYETLITKVTQYAARLVKKTDQCKTVMLCSHLFYSEESGYKNPKRALECLQRALKVADACVNASPSNLQLFVDIFDCYLYHFEKQNPVITDRFISGLIALINEHIVAAGQNPAVADSKFQFIQTVRYIEQKKNDAVSFSHFGQIVCKIPN